MARNLTDEPSPDRSAILSLARNASVSGSRWEWLTRAVRPVLPASRARSVFWRSRPSSAPAAFGRELDFHRPAGGNRHRKKRARRGIDEPKSGAALLDQGDVDGEIAPLLDELFGAVERIDEEEAAGKRAGRHAASFFRYDLHLGRKPRQRRQDDRFGVAVGACHRAVVALDLEGCRLAIMLHDGGAGAGGGVGKQRCGARVVEALRSPIARWRCCRRWG